MPLSRIVATGLVLGIAGPAAFAVGALSLRTTAPPPIEVRVPATTTPSAVLVADRVLKVYVAGAVAYPGVYEMTAGERVADAIHRAGGATAEADLIGVNLALRVKDEDRVIVPRAGDLNGGGAGAPEASGGRVNINTAAAPALESLPGIGEARARKIIESRSKDGPFVDGSDLVKRKLLPQSVYDGLRDAVTVR